jgi:hypothetical protein
VGELRFQDLDDKKGKNMKRGSAVLLLLAGFAAGLATAPATARAVDSSISGPLERTARAAEKIATVLDALAKK